MIRTLIATAALAAALVSCGSDSTSSTATTISSSDDTETTTGSTATAGSTDDTAASTPASSGDHAEVVTDYAVAQAATAGFDYDRDCVAGVVAKLGDADLELLYESTLTSTDPELSDDGKALGDELFACAKSGDGDQALIDEVIARLEADGSSAGLDADCVKTQLATLTDAQLQALLDSGPESTDPKARTAAFVLLDCLNVPGGSSTATT